MGIKRHGHSQAWYQEPNVLVGSPCCRELLGLLEDCTEQLALEYSC